MAATIYFVVLAALVLVAVLPAIQKRLKQRLLKNVPGPPSTSFLSGSCYLRTDVLRTLLTGPLC